MAFYLDTDLRQGRIFIAPYKQREPIYLIEARDKGQAERLLCDLNIRKINDPLMAPGEYQLVETVAESFGALKGNIYIYARKS